MERTAADCRPAAVDDVDGDVAEDRELMGALVNRRVTTIAAMVVAALIIALNVVLLYLTFFG